MKLHVGSVVVQAERPMEQFCIVKPFVLWLTGLSGSGKSTLASNLVRQFNRADVPFEWLDGDVVREAVGHAGFSRDARERHLRYVGFAASLLERHGVSVIASFVSPYRASRAAVRAMCESFIEIYLNADLAECERRDVKGLYRQARAGELAEFTGIGSLYEEPIEPEIVLDSAAAGPDECSLKVLEWLRSRRFIA